MLILLQIRTLLKINLKEFSQTHFVRLSSFEIY